VAAVVDRTWPMTQPVRVYVRVCVCARAPVDRTWTMTRPLCVCARVRACVCPPWGKVGGADECGGWYVLMSLVLITTNENN